jgi:surface antigen
MSRRLSPRILAILVCAVALAAPAQATGWVVVLKNTPAEDFNDEDIKQFLAAAVKLLNAPGEGPAADVAWNNAESGSGGHFKELSRSVDAAGRACRRLQLGVYSKQHAESMATWTVCRGEDGRWKIAKAR